MSARCRFLYAAPMVPPWKGAACLLALLLLAQWTGAPHVQAWAAARLASAQAVEICTHAGRRTVLLDRNNEPLKPVPHTDCCTPGHASPASEPPRPVFTLRPPVAAFAVPPAPHSPLPTALARTVPQQPRAPPFHAAAVPSLTGPVPAPFPFLLTGKDLTFLLFPAA